MIKKKTNAKAVERYLSRPTVYTFDFKDVPIDTYAKTLDALFRDPAFGADVEKRNRLVKSAKMLKSGSSELANIVRAIEANDKKLADKMYAAIVQTNIRSGVSFEFLSFSTLLHYYVDYTREGVRDQLATLTRNLYKVTFLADMLESVMVDVKCGMSSVFGGEIEFLQFDGVLQVLAQLRGFFKSVRPQEVESPEAQLYLDYSDSINDYLAKRLKTYSEKVVKIHPENADYTDQDLIDALNYCLPSSTPFDGSILGHTSANCPYIKVNEVMSRMNDEQLRKFEKAVFNETGKHSTVDNSMQFCFAATDTLLKKYRVNYPQAKDLWA